MGLETPTYISDLVITNPTSGDPKTQGDDHFRGFKSAVKTTFPNVTGAVNPTHTQLNYLASATGTTGTTSSNVVFSASPTFTGTVTAPLISNSAELQIATSAAVDIAFTTNAFFRWRIKSGGAFSPHTGNTYDIGDSTNTVRTVYAGTSVVTPNVQFPAVQVASADANTLDDYEEGTWTPSLQFATGSTGITYGSRDGTYTKIGRVVHYQANIVLTSKGSSTGLATISSPFSSAVTAIAVGAADIINGTGITGGVTSRFPSTVTGSLGFDLVQNGVILSDTSFTNTSTIRISGTYFV